LAEIVHLKSRIKDQDAEIIPIEPGQVMLLRETELKKYLTDIFSEVHGSQYRCFIKAQPVKQYF
jgi:hypothetical protein